MKKPDTESMYDSLPFIEKKGGGGTYVCIGRYIHTNIFGKINKILATVVTIARVGN